jgi:hypothetical protein
MLTLQSGSLEVVRQVHRRAGEDCATWIGDFPTDGSRTSQGLAKYRFRESEQKREGICQAYGSFYPIMTCGDLPHITSCKRVLLGCERIRGVGDP